MPSLNTVTVLRMTEGSVDRSPRITTRSAILPLLHRSQFLVDAEDLRAVQGHDLHDLLGRERPLHCSSSKLRWSP